MQHFRFSFLISFICLCIAAYWGFSHGGVNAALSATGIALILAILEISLSFDNAVVNASVLKSWDAFWQKLFLTVGIIVAVFGMRLIFPLVIVAFAADLDVTQVWTLAIDKPQEFSTHLIRHHAEVAAFGGIFLLLVFLNFLFDADKQFHWLGGIEKRIAHFGTISSIPVLIALLVVVASTRLVEEGRAYAVLLSGIWGVITYVAVDFISGLLEKEEATDVNVGAIVKSGGIGGFLYLEVLDASFSFDGVIGAFAITSDVVIIMLGLAIGALFVRSLTIYLVRQGTLEEYVYLEHGAHYAIGILALIMFASMQFHIPEIVTGLIGVAFIAASLWSSIKHKQATTHLN
ncbi:DUF475 domain-containing protein [Undibacterium fentianense]|uniref:DUF475 domain-containing protein n=1 Tax=Undibacterium fentianense TaxID=2828728 RepID=A0A941ID03_9BURK|nr:DUF475 domain-containing protein [Undibacterium fentianense]MBR7800779.1 DUF475 domain-containing protein [Undibacterium fentianense]